MSRPLLPHLNVSTGTRVLRRALSRATDLDYSYNDVGSTQVPRGYWSIDRSVDVGQGRDDFDRLATALFDWRVHREAGVRVLASSRAEAGADVAMASRTGGVAVVMTCRVIHVVDEPGRRGFSYGTLPGHPESGEERFTVALDATGAITFTVSGFSRPGTTLTAALSPVVHLLAERAIGRYLRAARVLARG